MAVPWYATGFLKMIREQGPGEEGRSTLWTSVQKWISRRKGLMWVHMWHFPGRLGRPASWNRVGGERVEGITGDEREQGKEEGFRGGRAL